MNLLEVKEFLGKIVEHRIKRAIMIWGPPGLGKSSAVAQVASDAGIGCVDVRLSQLAPTDIRGLPVADGETARWVPPDFLPRKGNGILFLDELNMAPPAVQGVAQQLVLDRRVGTYTVPDGWFIWAAGNRKEDRAAVFDMPSALANRFLHVDAQPSVDVFRSYALAKGIHEQVIAFLQFRPTLLHKYDTTKPAWPSPRSWEAASELHAAGMGVDVAVGDGSAAEFYAFGDLYKKLPDIQKILDGRGQRVTFPKEPSERYAVVVALAVRAKGAGEALNALRWLGANKDQGAGAEWLQLMFACALDTMKVKGCTGDYLKGIGADQLLSGTIKNIAKLTDN